MASFRYSFQKVVDLKSSQKMQAEWLLGSALGVLSAEEKSLHQLLDTQAEWEQSLQQASESAVPLSELQTIGQYLDYLQSRIEAKRSDVQRAEEDVVQSRTKLAAKMTDEKVWLKAKDRAFEHFRRDLQMKEQNELDELASVRFIMPAP